MEALPLQTVSNGLVFLGAVLAALGGFGAQYFSKQVSQYDKIQSTASQEKLTGTVNLQAEDIKVLTKQNIKLAELNHEISSSISKQTNELTSKGS